MPKRANVKDYYGVQKTWSHFPAKDSKTVGCNLGSRNALKEIMILIEGNSWWKPGLEENY